MKSSEIKPYREKLLEEQKGICSLCGYPCEDPCLDHSHSSGKIRAVICRKCNSALGKIENGVIRTGRKDRLLDIAKNLHKYLTSERDEIHPVHIAKEKKKTKSKTIKSRKRPILI